MAASEVHKRINIARRRRAIAASVGAAGVVLVVLAGVASYSVHDDAARDRSRNPS